MGIAPSCSAASPRMRCTASMLPPRLRYNRLAGQVTQMSKKLLGLPPHSRVRIELTDKLLDKLFLMGVINSKRSLVAVEKLTSAAFARRRLPVVLVRMKFCETLKQATQFIQQGHIRVGPEVVTDPAFFVTRSMEDFITWVDGSKVKRTVAKYNDKLDDFDLLGE